MDQSSGRRESDIARIGLVQHGGEPGAVGTNVAQAVDVVTSSEDADLLCFPECYLSGYAFGTSRAAQAAAVSIQSPVLQPLIEAVRCSQLYAVVGLLEHDENHGLYNSCLALGPEGVVGLYRKQHLPWMAADRFVTPGPPGQCSRIFDTPFGRVGMMICFDLRFPEAARELALHGADIIAMPTAWPSTAHQLPDLLTRARALENRVFLAVADRADEESAFTFLGRSQLIAPDGDVILDAGKTPGVVCADIEPARARAKHLVMSTNEYELEIFSARRPDCYAALTEIYTDSEGSAEPT